MKNDNMKKDWTDLLRERLENYAPQVPEGSFEELKKKMLAAGAAAGAGAAGGGSVPMRKGLRWLAVAASLAAVVAGGALLLRNGGKADVGPSGSDAVAVAESAPEENGAASQEAVAVNDSNLAEALAANDNTPANTAPAASSKGKSARSNKSVKQTVSEPVTVIESAPEDALADAGDVAGSKAENIYGSKSESTAEVQNQTSQNSNTVSAQPADNSDTVRESTVAAQPAGNTSNVRDIYNTTGEPSDLKPEPVRRQLKRFSLGASGILAANAGSNRDATPNQLAYEVDKYGNKYYSMGSPELNYHYTAPVSGGISLRYHLTNQFYAETGLRFTYLRTWVSPSGAHQNLLYAGIPVGLGYKFLNTPHVDLYGSAYGMASKCIMGRESTNFPSNYTKLGEIPVLFSAGVAPGAEYRFNSLIGIYAEPTLSWYFQNEKAPQTLYKENPLYFTLNLGLRFNL